MGKLIIDGNKVYEIDEECLEKKRHKEQEERKREWEQKWERNRKEKTVVRRTVKVREEYRETISYKARKTGTASAVPVSDCRQNRKARSIRHRIRCHRSRRVIRLTINSCCCRYRIRHRYHCCRIRNSITG